MNVPDMVAGPVRVRWDLVLVTLGIGLVSGLARQDPVLGALQAGAFFAAVAIHELGHAAMARAAGRPFALVLQLTGGAVYLRGLSSRRAETLVLLAGPVIGLLPFLVGTALLHAYPRELLGLFGGRLRWLALVWSVFQLLPFPPLDGGLLLRRVILARLGSATLAWRMGWILGFTAVLLLVTYDIRLLEPAVWLTGMAVVLGRGEAGFVRHLDAFEAWERGDHTEVVRRVRRAPEYLPRADTVALLELGVASALELEDVGAVEDLAARLPAAHPTVVGAAEWLLRRDRGFGARLAEQALDALDAEAAPEGTEADRWADLTLQLAIHEARNLEPESALGLLERAVALGFDSVERVEAEAAFARLADHPRWLAVLDRMRRV